MFKWNRHTDQIAALQKEIKELRDEVMKLKYENEVRVGSFQHYLYTWMGDSRPKVSLRTVVELIMEKLGMEVTQTQGYTVTKLEKKKNATAGEIVKGKSK